MPAKSLDTGILPRVWEDGVASAEFVWGGGSRRGDASYFYAARKHARQERELGVGRAVGEVVECSVREVGGGVLSG